MVFYHWLALLMKRRCLEKRRLRRVLVLLNDAEIPVSRNQMATVARLLAEV
jgi:hypothetical protein